MTETRVKPVSRIGENSGEKLTAWNGIAKVRSITLTYVTWAIKALPRNVKASTSCEQKFFTRNSRSRKVSSWFCYHHAHAVWNSTPGARSMWQTYIQKQTDWWCYSILLRCMDGLQVVSQNGQISAFLTMFVICFCFHLNDEVDFDEDSEEDIRWWWRWWKRRIMIRIET